MEQRLGVILAGGQARRMGGGDKCLLPLTDTPVLAHVMARLGPQVAQLALNANGDGARFAAFGLPILADPLPGFPGPLAGIAAAIGWAQLQGASAVVTVAADTPFLPPDLVARLLAEARPGRPCLAAMPSAGALDWQPVCGLWPVALGEPLLTALRGGNRKVLHVAQDLGATAALFDPEPDFFFNINTPADLQAARERAAHGF